MPVCNKCGKHFIWGKSYKGNYMPIDQKTKQWHGRVCFKLAENDEKVTPHTFEYKPQEIIKTKCFKCGNEATGTLCEDCLAMEHTNRTLNDASRIRRLLNRQAENADIKARIAKGPRPKRKFRNEASHER